MKFGFREIKRQILSLSKEITMAFLIYLLIQGALISIFGVYPSYRVVVSGSMEPVYYRGDVVFIKSVDPSTLQVGDIIVFENPRDDTPIVHRISEIIEENRLYFVTKGDNNFSEDNYYPSYPGIPQEHVIGEVAFHIPKVGGITLFLRDLLRGIF
ncbi:MAG: signal peptidase I [Candidatus Methanofastidiosia archaeon]